MSQRASDGNLGVWEFIQKMFQCVDVDNTQPTTQPAPHIQDVSFLYRKKPVGEVLHRVQSLNFKPAFYFGFRKNLYLLKPFPFITSVDSHGKITFYS